MEGEYLSNVPRTSILVGESDNGRDAGTGVSSCAQVVVPVMFH
jgi:hypothetical protein